MPNQGLPDTQTRIACGLKSLAFAAASALVWSLPPAHADQPVAPQGNKAEASQATQSLGEAAISNQVLRIVLRSQAQISLYNARGQMLYQGESQRGVATLPLKSIDFGFLFLTLRQGHAEQTVRLLHNGK